MKCIEQMTNEELLRAIDLCVDTGTSITPRGFADDFSVGSLEMAKIYRQELKRREQNSREERKIVV